MIINLINTVLLLIMPFLFVGTIKKTKAFFAGRKGASIFQPFYDFLRLLKKETVYPDVTTWVYKFAPVIIFSSVIFASLFVPMSCGMSIVNVPFAFVIFSYVLGFGKFFSLISALDTGSSFEGMGASREACFSTMVEPAFFILFASVIALVQINSFESLKHLVFNSGVYGYLIIILASIALFIMLLIEGCRVPVDDPATHLELTMIHEVMILDNSGFDLALITWASAIKMFLFASLITSLILPSGLPLWLNILLFILCIFSIAITVGIVESSMARFRMTHVFEFVFVMSILSLLILTLSTYRIYGGV